MYVTEQGVITKGFDEPFKLLKILKKVSHDDIKNIKGLAKNLDWYSSTIMTTYTIKNIPGVYNQSKNSEDVGKRRLEKFNRLRKELQLM